MPPVNLKIQVSRSLLYQGVQWQLRKLGSFRGRGIAGTRLAQPRSPHVRRLEADLAMGRGHGG